MKSQSLLLGKNKENIISLSSVELAHKVVKVRGYYLLIRVYCFTIS